MKQKITIITGGNSGLGFELSKIFSLTENICIVARDKEKLLKAAQTLSKCTDKIVISYSADISKEMQVKGLFESLSEYEISMVINCAGAGKFGDPDETTEDMVDLLVDSNLKSVILMSTNALKAMKDKGGTIVTILSTAALKGNPKESVYCAVKWGARGYCEALKANYKGSNIKVITVCPGGINTPFWKKNCGLSPNVEKFMNPAELATVIYNNVIEKETLFCPEMIIEKL